MYKINRLQCADGCLISFLSLLQVPSFLNLIWYVQTMPTPGDTLRLVCTLPPASNGVWLYLPRGSYFPCNRSLLPLYVKILFFICMTIATLYWRPHVCVFRHTLGSEGSLASQPRVVLWVLQYSLLSDMQNSNCQERSIAQIHVFLNAEVSFHMLWNHHHFCWQW